MAVIGPSMVIPLLPSFGAFAPADAVEPNALMGGAAVGGNARPDPGITGANASGGNTSGVGQLYPTGRA